MRSSTSSSRRSALSERPAGFPWALVLALLVVGIFELLFHFIDHRVLISNMYGVAEYHAVKNYVDIEGPADIAFVGSSRSKEGIVVPAVSGALAEAGFPGLRISNYSCAGARADETRAAVDHILDHGKPDLVLVGATARMLLGNEPRLEQTAIYWDLSDWRRSLSAASEPTWNVAPVVARNYMSRVSHLIRYRNRPTGLVDDTWIALRQRQRGESAFTVPEILRGDVTPTPITGHLTRRQRDDGDLSLVTREIPEERVERYVNRLLIDGEYLLGSHRERELKALLERCRREGVDVVVFEVPISRLLEAHLPAGTQSAFRARMRALCESEGVSFVPYEGPLGDELFAEQSHLNLPGGQILTRRVVEGVLLPRLRDGARDGD